MMSHWLQRGEHDASPGEQDGPSERGFTTSTNLLHHTKTGFIFDGFY